MAKRGLREDSKERGTKRGQRNEGGEERRAT